MRYITHTPYCKNAKELMSIIQEQLSCWQGNVCMHNEVRSALVMLTVSRSASLQYGTECAVPVMPKYGIAISLHASRYKTALGNTNNNAVQPSATDHRQVVSFTLYLQYSQAYLLIFWPGISKTLTVYCLIGCLQPRFEMYRPQVALTGCNHAAQGLQRLPAVERSKGIENFHCPAPCMMTGIGFGQVTHMMTACRQLDENVGHYSMEHALPAQKALMTAMFRRKLRCQSKYLPKA